MKPVVIAEAFGSNDDLIDTVDRVITLTQLPTAGSELPRAALHFYYKLPPDKFSEPRTTQVMLSHRALEVLESVIAAYREAVAAPVKKGRRRG